MYGLALMSTLTHRVTQACQNSLPISRLRGNGQLLAFWKKARYVGAHCCRAKTMGSTMIIHPRSVIGLAKVHSPFSQLSHERHCGGGGAAGGGGAHLIIGIGRLLDEAVANDEALRDPHLDERVHNQLRPEDLRQGGPAENFPR